MPKKAAELTAGQVAKLTCKKDAKGKPRKTTYAVGGADGLMIQITPPKGESRQPAKSWILRLSIGGDTSKRARTEIGLGSYPTVTLAQARAEARDVRADFREKLRQGVNPIAERRAKRSEVLAAQIKDGVTVRHVGDRYLDKKAAEFKGRDIVKRVAKIRSRMETYVYPIVGRLRPEDVELPHVKKILEPIWLQKPETAKRVQLDLEKILDLAGVEGLRTAQNPARWKGYLEQVLPKQRQKAKNHAALGGDQIPGFFAKLQADDSAAARALAFQILTAARPGEARLARWDQIDLKARTWTIAADDMKSGKAHVVPLSAASLALIKGASKESETYVFQPPVAARLDENSLTKKAKEISGDKGLTAHGFRSTFKDWCRDNTTYDDEVSELALAHVYGDATRAAYARGALLDKRRLLMADWERYCTTGALPETGKVVAIGGRKL